MPRLELSQVTKRFGGLEALRGVSLTFEVGSVGSPGALVAMTGPNGAGKTTLFEILTGFERPTTGTVRFDGVDLARLARHRIARLGIGRTFQVARLFPDLSALDNVLVGVTFGNPRRPGRSECRDRAERLLEAVGLHDRATGVARTLSLGEQKRLELAVALGPDPRLLLLDELTAGLSPGGRAEMLRFYAELRERGLTIVAIEHAFGGLVERADRMVVLVRGEVIADGPPADVLASPRAAEASLGVED